jgi:glycosyltransferase involved in cell wall biosynthesis
VVAIRDRGFVPLVVAPSDGSHFGRRRLFGIETIRFGYVWPRSLLRLTRGAGGVPENLKASYLARLQVLPMMAVFCGVALLQARTMDAVYANWIGAGIVGAVTALLTGKPLIVSFRGDDGYLARDRPLWRRLTKWVSSRADVIAPVSEDLRRILIDLGVDEQKVTMPRLGVDMDLFHPPVRDRSSSRVTVLFVGSLIFRKGLHDLLEAFADDRLVATKLEIVGDGLHRQELRKLASEYGLDDRIEWQGALPPVEVSERMRCADIFCLPSYMEGRPNVIREAMACALPVIATRTGGIPEMVVEGDTALLSDAGDVKGLRENLVTLVEDAGLRVRMGEAGHARLVGTGVTWDVSGEDFDGIFSSVLKPGV